MRSRFEGEEGGVERFLEVTRRLGFDRRQLDRTNKMFLLAEFKKSARPPQKGVDFEAKVLLFPHRVLARPFSLRHVAYVGRAWQCLREGGTIVSSFGIAVGASLLI